MPRPPRIDVEDGWCHVMNRGADRRNVFFDDGDRIEFGVRLADIYDQFGVETHAYCLMDNHYHTLFHCPGGQMSAAMQRLGSLYTRHVNDRLGRDGALFRGRFHSRVIARTHISLPRLGTSIEIPSIYQALTNLTATAGRVTARTSAFEWRRRGW